MSAAANLPRNKSSVINPAADLLLLCGGVFWILVGIHLFTIKSCMTQILPIEESFLFLGIVFLSNSHTAATLVRLYSNQETSNRFWLHSYASVLLLVPLLIACLSNSSILAVAALIYLAMLVDHTVSQSYGVTVLFCCKAGFELDAREKLILKLIHHFLSWFAILRQLTFPAFKPQSLDYALPCLGPLPDIFANICGGVLLGLVLVFFARLFYRSIKTNAVMPFSAQFLLLTSLIMFTSCWQLSLIFALFSTAFFHAIQYLVITTTYELKNNSFNSNESQRLHCGKYWISLILTGSCLFFAVPYLISQITAVPFSTAALAVMICASFHHFFADRVLWKLRDESVRTGLNLSKRQAAPVSELSQVS